jgi:hypothetical protein
MSSLAENCTSMSFEDPLYRIFFDEECSQTNNFFGHCGVDVVNQSMDVFIGDLRWGETLTNYVFIFIILSQAFVSGVPVPSVHFHESGTIGKLDLIYWFLWMACVVLQLLTSLAVLLLVFAAYISLMNGIRPCAQEWASGHKLIDVVALFTFMFQPVILFQFVNTCISLYLMVVGMRAFYFPNVPEFPTALVI